MYARRGTALARTEPSSTKHPKHDATSRAWSSGTKVRAAMTMLAK